VAVAKAIDAMVEARQGRDNCDTQQDSMVKNLLLGTAKMTPLNLAVTGEVSNESVGQCCQQQRLHRLLIGG